MSGGYFDYDQYRIQDIANCLERMLNRPKDAEGQLQTHGLSTETLLELEHGLKVLKEAFVYAHRIDWLLSADDGEESFHKRLKEDLAKL